MFTGCLKIDCTLSDEQINFERINLRCDFVIGQTLMRLLETSVSLTHGSEMKEDQHALWHMSDILCPITILPCKSLLNSHTPEANNKNIPVSTELKKTFWKFKKHMESFHYVHLFLLTSFLVLSRKKM